MNPEVHALTGAYALDALSGAEREEFERHLAECEPCAQEVAELRATATRLALAVTDEPPPSLKDDVLRGIRAVRQLPPETVPRNVRSPRDRRVLALRLSTAAAAVLLVAAVALGVVVVRQDQQLDRSRAEAAEVAEVAEVLHARDARVLTVTLDEEGTGDARMTVALSRSTNRALLLTDGMPDPPAGHDFQVWTGRDGRMSSAGLLTPDHGDAAMAIADLRGADVIAVSVEPDGGSPQPTGAVVAQAELPA